MKNTQHAAADWLARLGRQLARYFPGRQAVEMLSDYAAHFALGLDRGEDEETMVRAMGSPLAAANAHIRENWSIRQRAYLWQGLLAVSALSWLVILVSYLILGTDVSYILVPPALALGPLALFGCLRGRTRAEIEGAFPYKKPSLLMRLLPAAGAAGMSGVLLRWFARSPDLYAGVPNGFSKYTPEAVSLLTARAALWWLMAAALAWCVFRSVTASIRYIPCAVHAAGALLYITQLSDVMYRAALDYMFSLAHQAALYCFLIYLAGLALAAGFALYICRCMKRGAAWK